MATSNERAGKASVVAAARINVSKPLAGMLGGALLLLCGCSSPPKGTFTYYLPKAETTVKVTQTIGCNAAGDRLVQVVTVTPTTTYQGDPTAPVTLSPSKSGSPLSNTDLTFELTSDGRLAGVNIATVGQAGEVIKDVLSVAKIVAGAAGPALAPAYNAKEACKVVALYAAKANAEEKKEPEKEAAKGDKKKDDKKKDSKKPAPAAQEQAAEPTAVTIAYEGKITYKRNSATDKQVVIDGGEIAEIKPESNDAMLFGKLRDHIPGLGFTAKVMSTSKFPVPTWIGADTDVKIALNGVTSALIQVSGLPGDMRVKNPLAVYWEGTVPVPLNTETDRIYVPVPDAALFGSRKFEMALTEYGTISKISYGTTNAVSEGSAAAVAIGTFLAEKNAAKTPGQQAAALKDKNDLKYQQQREAKCLAKPEDCPGE